MMQLKLEQKQKKNYGVQKMVKVNKEIKDLLDAQKSAINLLKSQLQAKTDECERLEHDLDLTTTQFKDKLNENTALKQQLDISVEALEQTKTISFWAVGYYNKDDATSDVLEKFERIGTVAKTALDKLKN